MSKDIYLDAPNVGNLEKKFLAKAIDTGFVSTVGPFVAEFEDRFAKELKVKKAVSTQSGTAALHMALHELGITQGDEVIVPVLTFVATINPIVYVGARPVFVDVDSKTWNIDPQEIKKNITRKTKAILPVHLYGNPAAMEEIMKIAKEYGIFVIEDATESLGARYRGHFTGTFGDIGCFSFNGNKIITTGGGGMVVGRNLRRLQHIKFLINQAREKSRHRYHLEIGFNYRMTNIEAALGLAQIERLKEFLEKKKLFSRIYREELTDIKGINFQELYPNAQSSFWFTCIIFNKIKNLPALQKKLAEYKVPTRRIFMPVIAFPPYKQYKCLKSYNAYDIYKNGLCLPGSTLNSEKNIRYVCDVLKKLL